MVVVSLQENRIQVAVGQPGYRPVVRRLFAVPYDREADDGWQTALGTLWEKDKLPRKGITLILPRERVVSRVISLPDMPPKQLARAVDYEMHLTGEEMITDYMPLGGGQTMRPILAAACRKGVLEGYIQGFESMGLKLRRISTPMESQLKLLSAMEEMKDKTCLWLLLEGSGVVTVLAERGEYRYAGRGRLQTPPQSEDFSVEIGRIVSGTMQFQVRKRRGSAVTHVYFAGCEEEAVERCRPVLEELGVQARLLPGCSQFRAFPEGEHLRDWISCAGAFLRI